MHLQNHRGIVLNFPRFSIFVYFRKTVPYYTQIIKQEHEDEDDDENETAWTSLSIREQRNYQKMRKEVRDWISKSLGNSKISFS
jgi:hypothetical protein